MIDLTTRSRRNRRPRSANTAWVRLERGRSLGYRRPTTEAGRWSVRVYLKDDGSYRKKSLGTADDLVEADGKRILSYGDAGELARAWDPDSDEYAEGADAKPITVADVMTAYLDWYREEKKAYEQTRYAIEAHIVPQLGDLNVADLTTGRLRRWHRELAKKPARIRGAKHGKAQKVRHAVTDDEQRARRSTANRVLTILKAALNEAWCVGEERVTEHRKVWQPLKPFKKADATRVRYLDQDRMQRLVNACDLDFRDVVLAAFYTGARYGELRRMRVADMQPDVDGVHVPDSKSGEPRTIFLNGEGVQLFERLIAGRPGGEHVFLRADGEPWRNHQQVRRMVDVCARAKIDPRIVFHEIRHTYASIYIMQGGGLPDLAEQLGHADTRMVEKHYAHLAATWRRKQARRFAPTLGIKPGKVRRMRKKA